MSVRRSVAPAVVDMSQPGSLRESARKLQGTIAPMLVLQNHGCERACAELAAAAREHLGSKRERVSQTAHDLDGPLAEKADALRACLLNVCWRVLDACVSDCGGRETGARAVLADVGMELNGRLCLREYPTEQAADSGYIHMHTCIYTSCLLT